MVNSPSPPRPLPVNGVCFAGCVGPILPANNRPGGCFRNSDDVSNCGRYAVESARRANVWRTLSGYLASFSR